MADLAEMAGITPLYLLLAGGKSRRMGGGDKNLLDLGGRPLLAHWTSTCLTVLRSCMVVETCSKPKPSTVPGTPS